MLAHFYIGLFSIRPIEKIILFCMLYSIRETRRNALRPRALWFKLKGVMTLSIVDVLSELCSPFLKGGNSAFITTIASGVFPQNRISVTRITTAQLSQTEIKWDLFTKT